MDEAGARPLRGVKVADFSTLLPGPLASLMLAEAGAEVVKIERPGGGDEMRGYAPKLGASSAIFALLNRGKKSVTLDLKDPAERERALAIAAAADIVLEQFRPGVMARLGLGYADVARRNPRTIYCSITGYGQSGPKAHAAGHDLNYAAEAGLLSLVADAEGAPPLLPAPIADIAGGSYPAMINILLALRERDLSGRGRHLDIAMSDNLFALLVRVLASEAAGRSVGANEDLLTGASPRYGIYRTRDGRYLAAAPLEDKFWANFCAVLGLAEHAGRAEVAAAAAKRDAGDLAAAFAQREACCSLVASVSEAMADAHVRARGLFARTVRSEGATMPALPLPLVAAYRDPEASGEAP